MKNTIIQGDCLEVLKTLDSESVNCVITSPPYWALRDYGVEGQLGHEKTFQEYINKLCNIFDEVKRVLKKDGTCWVNLGDTYGCGSGGWNEKSKSVNGSVIGRKSLGFEKSLCQIPSRFAIEMTDRGWILRNEIIWYKHNCMPSSVKDRFTVDFEKLFFFVKNKKYYFDTQFEPYIQELDRWGGLYKRRALNEKLDSAKKANANSLARAGRDMRPNEQGRNKRTVWEINTKGFSEAHFATFPEALVETPIKAGCPEFICVKCGKAKEKITISSGTLRDGNRRQTQVGDHYKICSGKDLANHKLKNPDKIIYTDCYCNAAFEGGLVLDPFFGSGTTGVVAKKLNRNYIGIELNPEYIEIAERRLAKTFYQEKLEI